MKKTSSLLFIAGLMVVLSLNVFCGEQQVADTTPPYLNHSDTVTYVGKEACKNCHPAIYESFRETGMGQSFAPATRQKSAASFTGHQVVYDASKDLYYYPFWKGDSMYIS